MNRHEGAADRLAGIFTNTLGWLLILVCGSLFFFGLVDRYF